MSSKASEDAQATALAAAIMQTYRQHCQAADQDSSSGASGDAAALAASITAIHRRFAGKDA
ncbi:hypothetical protein HU675_0010705 [Bradyrhizobium septentrionale]|uniref:hypothetical protein n=1 Tax=Bradyrhizobium septentrionale TaxID=1404411 RepID=UPI001596B690|nr:hypothetical protein [Bradyrhizobium septentrionale]UGY27180.1 hypothetical protein HU675_0010705 [Bradyrhizobium septentrionale]